MTKMHFCSIYSECWLYDKIRFDGNLEIKKGYECCGMGKKTNWSDFLFTTIRFCLLFCVVCGYGIHQIKNKMWLWWS